jgi:hypothetical protein
MALLVLGLLAAAIFTVWALPFVGVIAIAIVAYLVVARRGDPSVATIERGRRNEPTGTVRSATGRTETTNQKVGQD